MSSRRRSAKRSRPAARQPSDLVRVGVRRPVYVIVGCLTLCLLGGDRAPSHAQAPPVSRAEPIRQLPATALAPTFARDVAQPAIHLHVTPESPRAGTRVLVTVETVGLDAESGLNWHFPEATGAEGESFEAAAIVDDSGRTCQIVWPEAGDFPISVETLQFEGKIVPGGDGQPDRFVPTKWQIVTGKVVLKLRAVGPPPQPAPDVPPVPTPSGELQQRLEEVRSIVAAVDKAKQATMALVWYDFAAALATAPVAPKTTAAFKSAVTHYSNAAGTATGLAGSFPGFSAALEKAFVATFGDEDVALDKAKAFEFAQAAAWACGAK